MTKILLAPCHGAAKFSITALVLVNLVLLTTPVLAQHYPVTAEQKATAAQAPDRATIYKSGLNRSRQKW